MTRIEYFKGLGDTLIGASVLAFLLLQRHAGFMILFVWFFFIPWLIYSAWIIVTRPALRALQTKKIIIWLLLSVAVVGYHVQLHQKTRTKAQNIADAVIRYMKINGACPSQLEEIGMDKVELRRQLGLAGYHCEEGKPILFYASTYVPFETDDFDFKEKHWVHRN